MFKRTGFEIHTLLLATALLTGCGGYSNGKNTRSTSLMSSNLITDPNGVYNLPPTTTGTTAPTGVPAPTGRVTGLPPITFDLHGVGYTSTTYTVNARSILKVKFTALPQDANIAGTGSSPLYSGLGVYVNVGSSTLPTPLLYNGVYGGAAESYTMDFSNAFSQTCSSADLSCRQPVTITISKPNYDYWCINFGYGCSWTQVSANHPWHGTVTVETDDTNSM